MADTRLALALARFDAANSDDPQRESVAGREYPRELLYARRMTHWLEQLAPGADPVVQLAVRSQHLCRWEIPRSDYPQDRAGYHRWRTRLYAFHAEKAGQILHSVGYDETTVKRVQQLLRKENLKGDPDTQLLEDVACLVFLEFYFADFAQQHDEERLLTILRKTWQKMSPRGQAAAQRLPFSPAQRGLLEKALLGAAQPPAEEAS